MDTLEKLSVFWDEEKQVLNVNGFKFDKSFFIALINGDLLKPIKIISRDNKTIIALDHVCDISNYE